MRAGEIGVCPWCGKAFVAKSSNQEYCCKNCQRRAKYAREKGVDKFEVAVCKNCGKEFKRIVGGSEYCSSKCREEARCWLQVPEPKQTDITAEEDAWNTHVYLVHKWVYEGMSVPGIAKMTRFPVDNIERALAEEITEHQQKMIDYYFIGKRNV